MKCYIASPFFSDEQIEEVNTIKNILKDLNIDYFSPKDFFVIKKNTSNKERFLVFKKNLKELRNSNFIICNTNNKDIGSIFEAGYAFAINKPIIYFNAHLIVEFNLMLSQSGMIVVNNFIKLKNSIERFKKEGKFYEEYIGVVE